MKVGVDRRLKVKDKSGHVGAVEKMLTKKFCSVQFRKGGYYVIKAIDDLTPIAEEEFVRKFR